MEDWVTIRNLQHNNPTRGTREIAGIAWANHNTLKRALALESVPEYKRKEKTNPEILLIDISRKKANIQKDIMVFICRKLHEI